MISVLDVEVGCVDPDVEVSISKEVSDVSRSWCWSHDPSCWSWNSDSWSRNSDSRSRDSDSWSRDSDSTYWNPNSSYGPAILRGSDSGVDRAGDEGLNLADNGGYQILVADGAGG